jgi:hypothetical protein
MLIGSRDLDLKRSISGYVFKLFGGAISWMSRRQVVVVLSTTEVEYMETTHASKEVVWLQRLCLGIGFVQQVVRLGCDNQSAIFLAKNLSFENEAYWCAISLCERHGWRQEGVVGEGWHLEECCRLLDKVCQYREVLLV